MEMPGTLTAVFGGAAALTILTACWGHVRSLMNRLMGLMIVKVTIRGNGVEAMQAYCLRYLKQTRTSFPAFTGIPCFVQPAKRHQTVGFEVLPDVPALFWKGWRPLLAGFAKGNPNSPALDMSVTFIRGFFSPDKLMLDALAFYNDLLCSTKGDSRFRIIKMQGSGRAPRALAGGVQSFGNAPSGSPQPSSPPGDFAQWRLLGWKRGEIGMPREGAAALDRMALSPEADEAVQEAQRWMKSRDWYAERKIPWRRGWLLHGKPGTGKTSFIRSVAQDLGIPVATFDLGSMSNREFTDSWTEALGMAPIVVLIEDIDGVFKGRENKLGEMGGGLSFDCLLNTIGGIDNADGVLLAVTTNDLSAVDPALGLPVDGMSTRPGRLDRILELAPPTQEGRIKIALRIFEGLSLDLVGQAVKDGANDTGAQFQERCSRMALEAYWSDRAA